MEPIKPLERQTDGSFPYDDLPASNEAIHAKVNEIIERINKLDETLG